MPVCMSRAPRGWGGGRRVTPSGGAWPSWGPGLGERGGGGGDVNANRGQRDGYLSSTEPLMATAPGCSSRRTPTCGRTFRSGPPPHGPRTGFGGRSCCEAEIPADKGGPTVERPGFEVQSGGRARGGGGGGGLTAPRRRQVEVRCHFVALVVLLLLLLLLS